MALLLKDTPPTYYKTMLSSSEHRRNFDPPTSQYIEPPQSSIPSFSDNAEDDNFAELLDFTHKPASPYAACAKLSHPVAIPQLLPGAGKPFARAFPPALAAHGIDVSEFLAFLDSLNIVSSGTPPLRILGTVGGLIGMVPWHYAQLLSVGVQVAAKAGNRIHASMRGDRFMEQVNRSFFAPRGLKVTLVTGEALAQMLGVDYIVTAQTVAAMGSARLINPPTLTNAMWGKIEELNFNVPPPVKPDNVLDQLSARVQAREANKFEKKLQDDISKRGKKKGSKDDKKVIRELGKLQWILITSTS